MRLRTALASLLVFSLLLGLAPVPAVSAEVGPPLLALQTSAGEGGATVGFVGVGFVPGEEVRILLNDAGVRVASRIAQHDGSIVGSFEMPGYVDGSGDRGPVAVWAHQPVTGKRSDFTMFHLFKVRPLDYKLPNGWFFTQTNGKSLGVGDSGHQVSNAFYDVEVRFYQEFERLGGVAMVGYPMSDVFEMDGFYTQVFQKAVFQWRPNTGEAFFLNVFDVLHDSGFDEYLRNHRSVPEPLDPSFDAGLSWSEVVDARQTLLNDNPAMKAVYFSVDNPLLRFGLPTSEVVDNGDHYAIRLQRAVLQQWKETKPWAAAGQVTIGNGGAIAAEVGLFQPQYLEPLEQPTWNYDIVVVTPDKGAPVESPFVIRGCARFFEANVLWDVHGADGRLLGSGFITAAHGDPAWGYFEEAVSFQQAYDQNGILRVYTRSPEDNDIVSGSLVNIPLWLTP